MKLMTVVAGVLTDARGLILVQQRPLGKKHGGLWEFPGGKVEAGETPEAALARELHEELDITIDRSALIPLTFASGPLGDRHMVLLLYRCARWTGEARPLDAADLHWATVPELAVLDMPPGDRRFVDFLASDRGG